MTDLPFDFSDTFEAFECPEPITAYEKTGSYVDGRWVEVKGAERRKSWPRAGMSSAHTA